MKSKYIKGLNADKKISAANKVVSAVGLFVLVVAVGVFVVYNPAFDRNNIFVILTFFLNIAVFVTQLLLSTTEHAFSFRAMFWTFNLFFFGLAPFYQYVSGSAIWGYKPTDREFVISNVYILIWAICFVLGGKIYFKRKNRKKEAAFTKNIESKKYTYAIRKNSLNILLVVAVAVVGYYAVFVGLENMFIRYTSGNKAIESTSMMLLEEHVLKNIPVFCFVFHALECRQKRIVTPQMVIATACLLICCFPTALARYSMAAVYASIMIILFDKTRKGRWFITVFILALVVVFPAINIFRSVSSLESATNFMAAVKENIESVYTEGDYDSYAMFINVRRYIGFFGHTYGNQLLGALFFFFPRSIWTTKPMGTGSTVFLALHPEFTNVSAPLIAEGYVDFGIIGVAVYALVAGAITSWADKKYWASDNPLSKERVVFPFLMFQFFFLLRGDLMSGGAYLIARMVMGLVTYYFVVKKVPVGEEETEIPKLKKCKYIK